MTGEIVRDADEATDESGLCGRPPDKPHLEGRRVQQPGVENVTSSMSPGHLNIHRADGLAGGGDQQDLVQSGNCRPARESLPEWSLSGQVGVPPVVRHRSDNICERVVGDVLQTDRLATGEAVPAG